MRHKFYVYKVIGVSEIITENQPSREEARQFIMKNLQHLNYKKPDYFYMILNKEPKEVK